MEKNKMNNDHGFSLMEVLVSMIVLAVGLLGLAPMVTVSIQGNSISRDNSVVSGLLRQKVEQFQSSSTMPSTPYEELEEGLENIYSRTTQINDHSSDSLIPDGLYYVEVAVNWVDQQNVNRSMSYATYVNE
jgi:type IV pilus assembly protein PilV